MTALQAEGCGLPLWAMLIKSALRDWLSVSYGMISMLVIGSLRSPPPTRLRLWTHLRCEGSQGSEGSKGSKGCGIALSGNEFYKPPSAVTSTSSIIIILTLVHPFATSWPSSPKGDARTLRDWLSVSYVTQYPVPPIFSFPLEGKCHVVAKGCTGLSRDMTLYHFPDRQSAAP